MNWLNLLSAKRPGEPEKQSLDKTRSRFEQDYDRIIFSHPFRKLQDKTQVFPLPEDDFVHTRLTHSLEVSSVGRSLGKLTGQFIIDKYSELSTAGIQVNDFGGIVGTACLAHDLGNPPFGHSGEDSISSFFIHSQEAQEFKTAMSLEEWRDIINFEGNAQGFRILNNPTHGGLKLTFAALGAFTKYPLSSSSPKDDARKSQKKFGFYQSNARLFEEMANEMGLISLGNQKWSRHPLAFLVEAADDICYHIIDLEDGCRLGLVPFETVKGLLARIIGTSFSEEKLARIPSLNEKLGTLRAMAINRLINECAEVFCENEAAILEGSFDEALTAKVPSSTTLKEIIKLSVTDIYQSKQVLEREAGGYEVIENLVSYFSLAAYHLQSGQKLHKHQSVFKLLPEVYKLQLKKELTTYELLQVVIDFVSGLTDSHAVRLYKTIKGYRLPF